MIKEHVPAHIDVGGHGSIMVASTFSKVLNAPCILGPRD